MVTIDARGLSCPQPVVLTKKALAENKNCAIIIVDNTIALENITRFAENKGLTVKYVEKNGDYEITIG
ncbi:MAG: sulfurtransferase TusA family protein [Oscillospiraceae bacterium]